MKLISSSFRDGGTIPGRCAFAVRAHKGNVRLSANRNPHLAWRDPPAATKSFVLLCTDADAPTKPDDVNKQGREVPAQLARADFVHWVLVDIPADVSELPEGAHSEGVSARGKKNLQGPGPARHGMNDYTGWFKGDPDMEGVYLGYDGPCPPWNDSIPHHYRFELFATDLESCAVDGHFTSAQVRKAIEGHVLAQAGITGRYALNPRVDLRTPPMHSVRRP